MFDSEFLPRSARCDGCKRIFIKNESRQRHCSGCTHRQRRTKDCGHGVCPKCMCEFERKVMRQRFCSEECRKGGQVTRYG